MAVILTKGYGAYPKHQCRFGVRERHDHNQICSRERMRWVQYWNPETKEAKLPEWWEWSWAWVDGL